MATNVEDVVAKTEMIEIEPKTGVALKSHNTKDEKLDSVKVTNGKAGEAEMKEAEERKNGSVQEEQRAACEEPKSDAEPKGEAKVEEVPVEVEPKTGVSFPIKLDDGKRLMSVGLRKKSILGLGIKIYGFGMYADREMLKDVVTSKIGKAPEKPSKELYQAVIDSDAGMMVRLVITYSGLTMSLVRKNFDESLGAAIKKLTGGKKDDELSERIMGEASNEMKLTAGSVIEISRLPGFVLQTKVLGEVVSKVESELLCRAYVYLYLGDDPFDKEAKEKFGMSLLSNV